MSEYLLYRLGQVIALGLPLKLAYGLAVVISDLRYPFAAADRAVLTANLKAIFPAILPRQLRGITLQVFRNFAKYLVDFFRFPLLDEKFIRQKVHIENLVYLDEALKEGKGVIVVSAHLGNWEMGGAVVGRLGYKIAGVALSHTDKRVNDFFINQRKQQGLEVIPFEHAVRGSLAVLRNNGILALVADRDFTRNGGVEVDFLGRKAILPRGPAALALKTGAVILPVFMLRNTDDSFTLKIERPIRQSDRQTDELGLVYVYKAVIEEYVKRYPEQWYFFRRFWVE
jgi:KDO2-lipid IV(A) lauroyltransferase